MEQKPHKEASEDMVVPEPPAATPPPEDPAPVMRPEDEALLPSGCGNWAISSKLRPGANRRSMQAKPNIILISADSLRANHLGCYQYPLPTSPHIDKLACQGVLCENMFAPGIPTQPSHTTIFTGQHPVTHGVVAHGGKARLTRGTPFLP